jgi:hypothetical protein
MGTNETGRTRRRDPIRPPGSESLIGIVLLGGAADTQAWIIDGPRAKCESPCAYCGLSIRVGEPIARTYLRVGWGVGWAYGRCSKLWWLHADCAKKADDRRRIEPPRSRAERDEIKARALRRYRSGQQYIPPDELPEFEASAERVAQRRNVRDERRSRSEAASAASDQHVRHRTPGDHERTGR